MNQKNDPTNRKWMLYTFTFEVKKIKQHALENEPHFSIIKTTCSYNTQMFYRDKFILWSGPKDNTMKSLIYTFLQLIDY